MHATRAGVIYVWEVWSTTIMVVSVTEDYIKTSQWCVSRWCELLESGNISTNWCVTDSIILLFPATHCWVYRYGIHFIHRKNGHKYNLTVKRNAKTMRTFLYNAFPIQTDVNVEEVFSLFLKNVGRGLWVEHNLYTDDDLNSQVNFDTYRGWSKGLCLWFTKIESGSRRLNLGGANVPPCLYLKIVFIGWVE